MRVVDRRIRVVARAISDESPWGIHPIDKDTPPYRRNGAASRASHRYANIRAAVRVLDALDGDVIDQWTDTVPSCGGEIRGWISPPHGTAMRVHVTVSHVGPAPGPIANLTDDEADRFADAIQEGR